MLKFDLESLNPGEYDITMVIRNTSSVPNTDWTYQFNVTIVASLEPEVEETEETSVSTED